MSLDWKGNPTLKKKTVRTIVMTVAVVYMVLIFAGLCMYTFSEFNEILSHEVEQKLNYKVELTSTKLNSRFSNDFEKSLAGMREDAGYYFVIDKAGRYVASQNPKHVIGKAISDEPDIQLQRSVRS